MKIVYLTISLLGVCAYLPLIPVKIIWIPVISSPIPIMIPASIAPKNGNISTVAEITTVRIPTPIRNTRAAPECLPEKPCTK